MQHQDPTVIPPPAPELSTDRLQRRTEEVMVAFGQLDPPAALRRHRPPRRVVAIADAMLVLLGVLAVGAYARLRPCPVTQLSAGAGCFAEASLRSDVAVVELGGLDPIARRQEVWASGGMGEPRLAPPLVACVYPSGALAVLPGKDFTTCDRLACTSPRPVSSTACAASTRCGSRSRGGWGPPPCLRQPGHRLPGHRRGAARPRVHRLAGSCWGWTPAAASSARSPRPGSTAAC
jgi:hypothetical protein